MNSQYQPNGLQVSPGHGFGDEFAKRVLNACYSQ